MAKRMMMPASPDELMLEAMIGEQDLDCDVPAWTDTIEYGCAWRPHAERDAANRAALGDPAIYRMAALDAAAKAGGFLRAAMHERVERAQGGEFDDEVKRQLEEMLHAAEAE